MREFEREEANIDELEQIGEFINFKEEDYQCNELLNDGLEEFKVEEIQPQSFVESATKNIKKDKNKSKDELRRKINNQLKTSINTSATSSSITAVTVTAAVSIGAVSVGIVTPPSIDYGKLEFLNYRVDTRLVYDVENNENIKYKDIEIYFDEELNDNYICNILNKENQEILELDKSIDFVRFTNLEADIYNFEVQIVDETSEIIETFDININTVCDYDYVEETPYEYTITYNDDNTVNLYFDVNMVYEDINISNYMELTNEDGEKLDYTSKENDDILVIEDIKEQTFGINTFSYYEKEGNYYLINNNHINDLMPHKFSYEISAELNELSISLYNEAYDNLNVSVRYLDDNTVEDFTISKNNINESQEIMIKLSRISSEIEVTLIGEFIMYGEMDFVKQYKGVFSKKILETKVIKPLLYDKFELSRIELLEDQYTDLFTADLYFEGYLMNDNYIDVNVYNSLGNLVNSQTNITSFKNAVSFNELEPMQELTFEYILKDGNGNEKYKNQYKASMIIPSEYSSIDYSFYQINPLDVYLTYNDDMTYNIYFPSEFENNSEYDVNYKISVMDIDNEEVYYLIGNDRTPYLLNCKGSYGLGYNVFVKEDIMYYSISSYVVVSGSIYVEYDDDGFIVGQKYCDYEMLEEGLYKIRILSKVYDDIKVKITLDNSEIIEVVIPLNEITFDIVESSFILDLTDYQFEFAECEITGLMNEYITFEDRIDKNNIVGQESALHIYNVLI